MGPCQVGGDSSLRGTRTPGLPLGGGVLSGSNRIHRQRKTGARANCHAGSRGFGSRGSCEDPGVLLSVVAPWAWFGPDGRGSRPSAYSASHTPELPEPTIRPAIRQQAVGSGDCVTPPELPVAPRRSSLPPLAACSLCNASRCRA